MPPECSSARHDMEDLRIGEGSHEFYPLNELREFFREHRIRDILMCDCEQCKADLEMFDSRIDREAYIDAITGGSKQAPLTKTYYSVFGLLLLAEHPLLIIGFLDRKCNDYILENWVLNASEIALIQYTGHFQQRHKTDFERFVKRFHFNLPSFAIPHLEPDKFSQYHKAVILPFIEEKEIGKKRAEDGHLTSEGANGKVYAFKIQREYNQFPNTNSETRFVRKRIETDMPKAYLERSMIQFVQRFKDEHIVKLFKAYGHDESINLILPLARTNLDHLLRDQKFLYYGKNGRSFERADAWKQLLGISGALKQIHGHSQGSGSTHAAMKDDLCIHFDLKPDNILIDWDGTWLITDFGQAALIGRRRGTTPRVGGHFGTDSYAPPEIDDTTMEFGRAYDIWSLGCIMLEVTAFMVLGHVGLLGSEDVLGLDQARKAMPQWARNRDERFFCQESPGGEYVVKKEIREFMVNLNGSHARLLSGEESKEFLKKILRLINNMLKPEAKDRWPILSVVELLSSAIKSTKAGSIEQQSHLITLEPDEHLLYETEMSKVEMFHWSATDRGWEERKLTILKNDAGFMRLHCWGQGCITKVTNLHCINDKLLPFYAFRDPLRNEDSNAWIALLACGPKGSSLVPDTKFAFREGSGLEAVQEVQSVLTSQSIVGSYPLDKVIVRKPSSVAASMSRTFRKLKLRNTEAPSEVDSQSFSTKSATLQIWIERRDEFQPSLSRLESAATTSGRPVRHAPGDRSKVGTRRLCIYFHDEQCICTIRIDINWALEHGSKEIMFLKGRSSGGPSRFYASWIRPTPGEHATGHPAGVPLDPKVLSYYEDSDSVELENIEMTFPTADVLAAFKSNYDNVKEKWYDEAKGDRTEVNKKPEGVARVPNGVTPLPPQKSRVSLIQSPDSSLSSSRSSDSTTRSKHDSTLKVATTRTQNPNNLMVPSR